MINKIIKTIKSYFGHAKLMRDFVGDYEAFEKLSRKNTQRLPLDKNNNFPQLYDKTTETNFDAHYIYHPAWAARVISKLNPKLHVDIGAKLYFVTLLSAFVPVDFYDYRPANIKNLTGLNSKQGDLMTLPFKDNSVESISCMHTIEHIGLGRYGDPLDPDGDLKAIRELKRVTAKGGTLIFVTPVGKPRLMFNAHRIYSYEQIISYFDGFELKEFSLIPDDASEKGIILNAPKELVASQNYGCGCFWFVKKQTP